ncbi:MAG: ribosome small subunit-dependent GTPase A [Steroidobacteraceae bacterium]
MSSTLSLHQPALHQLGWRPFFQQQLSTTETVLLPARVTTVQRAALDTLTERGSLRVTLPAALLQAGLASVIAVGDWVMVDPITARVTRLLERQSVIARLAAGEATRQQLIAANIDTLFIVTSCNDDFNVSRLERYLALAYEARIEPVIVITKIDLCADIHPYRTELNATMPLVPVVFVDAAKSEATQTLSSWLVCGASVAFVGSSGVGKSTLVNTLSGETQRTGSIREKDAKGRHTTTSRQLLALPSGAWVIDTPGVRELKIGSAESGVEAVFSDIESLAQACRFRDCSHDGERNCAVTAAIANGDLEQRRLDSYRKLQREAVNAARTLAERRANERHFGKLYKQTQHQRRKDRGRE